RLPCDPRHDRARRGRAGPHPRRWPARTGCRRAAQRCRCVRALDRGHPCGQARRADAAVRDAAGRRVARDGAVPGWAAMSTAPQSHDALVPAADQAQTERLHAAWRQPKGWRYWSSVNNTEVGRWYTATAIAFFLFGGLLALLMRLQLAVPGNDLVSADTYNQLFTLHGSVMMFLFAVPIFEAFSILVLPPLLGARDLPFPRLSAFGFWCFLIGGVFVCGSIFFDAAPKGGWFMYP